MPYTWLVIGIGYRKSKVKREPGQLEVCCSIPTSTRAASPSCRTRASCSAIASNISGNSVNSNSPELLKKVEAMLIKQKPNIKAFHEDNGQDLLLSGEVDVVLEYNGDIAQIMTEDDDIDFVVPKEGAMKQSGHAGHPEGRAASGERAQVHQLHLGCRRSGPRSPRPSNIRRRTRPPWR